MKKGLLSLSLVSCLAINAYASDTEMRDLRERLEALERNQQVESEHWADRIGMAGLVEVEAGYTDNDNFEDKSASDIVLATVEFAIVAQVSEAIHTEVALLYEENVTDLEIDIAKIHITELLDGHTALEIGRFYQPFGAFETYMVNDTLVHDIAENRETAVLANWDKDSLEISAWVFSGEVDSGGNTLKNYGLSAEYSRDNISVAAEYISNVYNSDTLSDAVGDEVDNGDGALIFRANGRFRGINVIAEYFRAAELSELGNSEPQVFQLEGAIKLDEWTYAAAVQLSDDAALAGLPESRWSLSAGVLLNPNVKLNFEYWHDRDYDQSDGGSDEKSNSLVGQISVFF